MGLSCFEGTSFVVGVKGNIKEKPPFGVCHFPLAQGISAASKSTWPGAIRIGRPSAALAAQLLRRGGAPHLIRAGWVFVLQPDSSRCKGKPKAD